MTGSSEAAASRLDLLDRATRYATNDYEQATAVFAALDSKAQATFGISGVFVAGTVALLNSLKDKGDPSGWVVTGLVAIYVVLVGAIATSILALKVRDIAAPMSTSDLTMMTSDMVALTDEELTTEMRASWYREQLRILEGVTTQLEKTNSDKASRVAFSQWLLLTAIILAGLATVMSGLS
jgi:hypothetical protein